MRRRLFPGILVIAITGIVGAACDGTDPVTPPTGPSPTTIIESFSGTLTVNGGVTFPFSASQVGAVTAVLTALAPDGSVVGLSIGTSTGVTCQVILSNDTAGLNTQINGAVTAAGTLCLRVYDVGLLEAPVTFTVSVEHL